MDWNPLWLTAKLSFWTTAILFVVGIPLARWLAGTRSRWRHPAQALVTMPMVLPPTVIGFYLLIAFSPRNAFGALLEDWTGIRLAFSFPGILLGSLVFSLPFMVNPLVSGFTSLPGSLMEASYVLGKSQWATLWRVQLPNMKPALLSAGALTFAHTVGEFGVVLMLGGKIPGETRVASIAVYDEVEKLNFGMAHTYSAILVLISFVCLLALYGGSALRTGSGPVDLRP